MEKVDKYQKFLNDKAKKKREILGKMFFPRTPVVMIDLSRVKKAVQYNDLISGLNDMGIAAFVILPAGRATPERTENVQYVAEDLKSDVMQASDFVVAFDNKHAAEIRKKGCVPISQMNGNSTADYDPLKERGNGFYFKNPTKWEIFAAIIRALETYQFPYDWENLMREILKG